MLISGYGWSQRFPVTGQLASTAFPVCALDTFKQTIVPYGYTHDLKIPNCDKYQDLNPFWYSFTCYESGTLGFLITPNNLGDDYDWMLFDITGHKADEAYTNASLIVTGNWSGTYGLTGARRGGVNFIQCASYPPDKAPKFSAMPTLKKGHHYLLLISHFTRSQSGYKLSFGGGTAVITDPLQPHLKSARMGCDRKSLTIVLNKKMQCKSLAADGSDFMLDAYPLAIISAAGSNCNNQFDMDSLVIKMNAPLPEGNYSIKSKTGTDGNTLLDDCGALLPEGENLDFVILPPHPTPMDSLTPPACAPNILQLVFSDPMLCNSIAPDGSDFTISGDAIVAISKAGGDCSTGQTGTVNIELSSPLVVGGNYRITLKAGTDGNTLINECGLETPAGSEISFSIKDTVTADFSYQVQYGCKFDTIQLNYAPVNGVNEWEWIIDSSYTNSQMDPTIVERVFGPRNVQHIVSNGFCSDTVTQIVNLDNELKAVIDAPNIVCPKDLINFTNASIGNLVSSQWSFGDGGFSTEKNPAPHLYPDTWEGRIYAVTLGVQNNLGCIDSATANITKLQSCIITVPNAFTPNGDGKNDFLYPLNAFLATDLEFQVYNRYGQLVFETRDWSRKWDGTIGGAPQQTGSYIWTLRYRDSSGKKFFLRGSSTLIR